MFGLVSFDCGLLENFSSEPFSKKEKALPRLLPLVPVQCLDNTIFFVRIIGAQ